MADLFYDVACTKLLDSSLNLLTNNIQVALIGEGYTPLKTHASLSDIEAYEIASDVTYERKTLTLNIMNNSPIIDAADVTWSGINDGRVIGALIYQHNGVTASGNFPIMWIDEAGFPITTNGGDVQLKFNINGIFSLSGA